MLGRLKFIKPDLLAIWISDTSDPDGHAAIDLHYEGLDWKLGGLEMPKVILRDLAPSLPEPKSGATWNYDALTCPE